MRTDANRALPNMKRNSPQSLFLAGLSVLAFTACGRAQQKAPDAPAPPADAAPIIAAPAPTTAEVMAKLKAFTYEQRADFLLMVQDLDRQSDAALANESAGYIEVKSTPARRKAMDALRAAVADFKDKTAKIDNAKAENWESITVNLANSWENLQGAHAKARTEAAKG